MFTRARPKPHVALVLVSIVPLILLAAKSAVFS